MLSKLPYRGGHHPELMAVTRAVGIAGGCRETGDLAGGGLEHRGGLDLGAGVAQHPGPDVVDRAGAVERPGAALEQRGQAIPHPKGLRELELETAGQC